MQPGTHASFWHTSPRPHALSSVHWTHAWLAGSHAVAALREWVGPAILGAVAAGTVAVWLGAHPADEPSGRYAGELFGVEAVLLFSCSLVLATLLPPIERAFGGLDRVAVSWPVLGLLGQVEHALDAERGQHRHVRLVQRVSPDQEPIEYVGKTVGTKPARHASQ